jgi:RNA polymerase sigma-70 factor (ECF subfamily)
MMMQLSEPETLPVNNRNSSGRSGSVEPGSVEQLLRSEISALVPRLTRYARALTHDITAAEDLVQDCVTIALRKIHLWEPGTDLRAWLFTILHHQYINGLRRDARHRASIKLQKSYQASVSPPDQHTRLELRDLERALRQLPEDQRSLVLVVGVDGLRYEDAASAFNIPLGTVRSRVARGRDKLRSLTERISSHDYTSSHHAVPRRAAVN